MTLVSSVIVYDATSHNDRGKGRALCMAQLVADLVTLDVERLVVETADAAVATDRLVLYDAVRLHGATDRLRYVHMRAREETLLAVPDAIAWCWSKGGEWRASLRDGMTIDVRRL
jgi:hypothetical protein